MKNTTLAFGDVFYEFTQQPWGWWYLQIPQSVSLACTQLFGFRAKAITLFPIFHHHLNCLQSEMVVNLHVRLVGFISGIHRK